MYISLTPDPGYNLSFLKTCGIDGEFNLFRGSFSKDKDDLNGIVGDHHGQRINSFIDEFIDSSSKDTENLNGIAGDYHGQWIKAKDDRTGFLTWGGDCNISENCYTLRKKKKILIFFSRYLD